MKVRAINGRYRLETRRRWRQTWKQVRSGCYRVDALLLSQKIIRDSVFLASVLSAGNPAQADICA